MTTTDQQTADYIGEIIHKDEAPDLVAMAEKFQRDLDEHGRLIRQTMRDLCARWGKPVPAWAVEPETVQ